MQIICLEKNWIELLRLKRSVEAAMPEGSVMQGFMDKKKALQAVRDEGCDVFIMKIGNEDAYRKEVWKDLDYAREVKKENPRVNLIFAFQRLEGVPGMGLWEIRISGFVTKPYKKEDIAKEFANLWYGIR